VIDNNQKIRKESKQIQIDIPKNKRTTYPILHMDQAFSEFAQLIQHLREVLLFPLRALLGGAGDDEDAVEPRLALETGVPGFTRFGKNDLGVGAPPHWG